MNKAKIAHEIEGLEGRVLVDGFRFAMPTVEAYFLTHFHGDHYQGLTSAFEGPGLIHCTSITARLVVSILGVNEKYVKSYEFGECADVCNSRVTFLDANHCPGASLLLICIYGQKESEEKLHLHTGDMRYNPLMKSYPALIDARGRIDRVYLDTTYCHPKHSFPSQEESVRQITDSIIERLNADREKPMKILDAPSELSTVSDDFNLKSIQSLPDLTDHTSTENDKSSQYSNQLSCHNHHDCCREPAERCSERQRSTTLFLLSAYKIGKERVLLEVARRTGLPVYVDEAKARVLACLGMSPADLACFTTDMSTTPIHVCRMGFAGDLWPYFRPNFPNLETYLRQHALPYVSLQAFIPTGWAVGSAYNRRNAHRSLGNLSVSIVPYSEHSDFAGLRELVGFLRPRRVVPTVFSDPRDARAMAERFADLVDRPANLRAFLASMRPTAPPPLPTSDPPPAPDDRHLAADGPAAGVAGSRHAKRGREDAGSPLGAGATAADLVVVDGVEESKRGAGVDEGAERSARHSGALVALGSRRSAGRRGVDKGNLAVEDLTLEVEEACAAAIDGVVVWPKDSPEHLGAAAGSCSGAGAAMTEDVVDLCNDEAESSGKLSSATNCGVGVTRSVGSQNRQVTPRLSKDRRVGGAFTPSPRRQESLFAFFIPHPKK